MDPSAKQAEQENVGQPSRKGAGQKNVRGPSRKSRRSIGVRAQIGKRKKNYWKRGGSVQSTSTDTSADDVEETAADQRTCSRSLSEAHDCFESDGGFSETTSEYTDSENVQAEGTSQQKRKRRRKTFLSLPIKRRTKTVGFLRIDDGVEDKGESADDEEDDDEDNTENENMSNASPGEMSIPEDISLSENMSNASSGELSIPEDISLSDPEVEDCDGDLSKEILHPNVAGGSGGAGSEPEHTSDATAGSASLPKVPKDTSTDPDDPLEHLKEKLIFLLPSDFTIDVVEESILRIINLNKVQNASVQTSIFYNSKNTSVGLFVLGIPVSRDHKVFSSEIVPDSTNLGSVADYLFGLVTRVLFFKVCQGIKHYEESFWETSNVVYIDHSSSLESLCYRHVQCDLLIPPSLSEFDICFHCQSQIMKFEREIIRREKGQLDPSTIADKYLTKEGMKAKKNKFRMLFRKEKQKADRLEKRLDSLQIKLDLVMQDDLSSILRSNQQKMTPLQKTFWSDQMKVLSLNDKCKSGMRWHPMLIRLALHLHSLSNSAYQFINESKVFTLPSSRRLYDYSHFIEASEGCQPQLTSQIKEKIKKCGDEEHFSYVNLMFDEMHIRSGLVFTRSSGELVGYTKLSGVEEELKKLENELNSKKFKPRLAKKVLVYLAQGITSNVKDVVAVHSTDDLSASQLYSRTWDVIYHLEEANIKVLTVTCDGASVNRKFISMHESLDKSCSYCYSTKNLASGDSRPLFFILDPPHLLKTLRNALANSFCHRKSRQLWKNGQFLSWKVIEALFEMTKNHKFRVHKLTKAHIKLTSFSCMTVFLATQTLSNSVAKCTEEMANSESLRSLDSSELVRFIKLTNRFFDCVNGKDDGTEKKNPDKAPFVDPNDERLEFLENEFLGYFEQWKLDVLNRPGIYTDAERNRMIVSHQALGALQITVKGITGAIRYMLTEANAPSVGARMFNQDPLEQYFGMVRRKQGDNRNPTLKAMMDTRYNIHAQGHVSLPSRKGNTEAEKRKDIEVDSSTLPSRKVPRKEK